jgi:endonuclease G, mitochondrial
MLRGTLPSSEPSLRDELSRRLEAGLVLSDADRFGVGIDHLKACLEPRGTPAHPVAQWLVTRFLRPALPLAGNTPSQPEARFWDRRLRVAGREIARAARAVGRMELEGHPGLQWAGSCWLVGGQIAVTTRAVASRFAHLEAGRMVAGLRGDGPGVTAYAHFDGAIRCRIKDVLVTDATALGSELAFLVLESGGALPDGVPLSVGVDPSACIAAVGWLAVDSRAGSVLSRLVYSSSADLKCIAPGRLLRHAPDTLLRHDCATLDDGAGALLCDLGSGRALGIHLTGALDGPGVGVTAADVLEAMKALGLRLPEPRSSTEAVDEDTLEARRRTAEDYADRAGYQSDFLGIDVPPPAPRDPIREDVVTVGDPGGERATLLLYAHFSVCMSRSRRMCFFTACNVHGGRLQDMSRAGIRWLFDARIDEELQAGDDLYRDNDLDRGHQVRRLDPVWGDDAETANGDTFHFTNSCPQHKDLNQKTWNDLEDYVLDNAGKYELKLNVFTGPVFRDDDPEYRDFRLPLEFWKVVVMVKDDGQLSATGYMLSQADLVTGLEFVFGEFRTYQVPLTDLERLTHLDFGTLGDVDPKKDHGVLEVNVRFVPIESAADIQL